MSTSQRKLAVRAQQAADLWRKVLDARVFLDAAERTGDAHQIEAARLARVEAWQRWMDHA